MKEKRGTVVFCRMFRSKVHGAKIALWRKSLGNLHVVSWASTGRGSREASVLCSSIPVGTTAIALHSSAPTQP